MDINKYRRKIEQSVAKAAKAAARPTRTAAPQGIVANKKASPRARVDALGRATRDEGPDAVPETALTRLADPKESPAVRLAAIKLLQQKQFFSTSAAEWRPAFVDALRTAVKDKKVRPAALEVLSLFKDRPTQELLLEGIRTPAKALVPLPEALRLLSTDIHADVVDVARRVTDTPQLRKNKAAFVQAVRIMGADPGSVGKLQDVVANESYDMDARRAAATAVSHLAPETLKQSDETSQGVTGQRRGGKRPAAPRAKGPLAKHLETLRRVRG